MDRSDYSKKTLSVYELVSSHFVDIFYNKLFLKARDLWTHNKCISVTDGYKQLLYGYNKFVDGDKFYKETIMGVITYFKSSTRHHDITFNGCVDRLVVEFVPSDFITQLSSNQKDAILNTIFKSIVHNFMREILSGNGLKSIIDGRGDENYIRILQDKIIDMLCIEREKLYMQLLKTTSHKAETVPQEFIDKMRKRIDDLARDAIDKQNKLKNCIVIIKNKNDTIQQLNDEIDSLKRELNTLKFKRELVGKAVIVPTTQPSPTNIIMTPQITPQITPIMTPQITPQITPIMTPQVLQPAQVLLTSQNDTIIQNDKQESDKQKNDEEEVITVIDQEYIDNKMKDNIEYKFDMSFD